MQDTPLDGKVAIVTGAGSPIGLGRAMTLAFVRAGARVAMLDVDGALAREGRQRRPLGRWARLRFAARLRRLRLR